MVTVPKEYTDNVGMGYRKVLSKAEPKALKGTYHIVTLGHHGVTLTLSSEQVELEFSKIDNDVISIISSIIHGSELYKSLTGTGTFVGKPRRKGYRDIFSKKNYSVTDTYNDGERHLFYMDVHGVPSFVTKQMDFMYVPGEKPRPGASDTVIDGEFVNGTFFAFDILFSHGTDVRKKPLVQRLDILFDTLMNLRMNILRMKIFYVEKPSGVYEYPGKKPTKFQNLYEASKFIKETKKKSNLLLTPSDYFNEPMYELSDFPKEHSLDGGLETYFESRDKLEKLLVRIHKNLSAGDMFVGTVRYSQPSAKIKLIGQKNNSGNFTVDFGKFSQIMKKWDFDLFDSIRKGSDTHFWFIRT
jgi:hypothetical protein